MCIIHTVRYASCNHVHSYIELVHENAIYCPDQQVAHDGITKSQDECPDCVKVGQGWLRSMEGDRKDDGSDLCRAKTGSMRVEDGGDGLEFVEDSFAGGSQAHVPRDWDGGAMWLSNEEWQLVQHREPEWQEIAGREDEMVVVDHEGEVMNGPLHVAAEAGRQGQDPPTSVAELVWGKQEEQNGTRVWKPTWRMMEHGSWLKKQ
jgi:hypothetical protein